MTKTLRVNIAHHASYNDPIAVEVGDRLKLSGKEDNWDGHRWLWAIAPDGKQGWVPDNLINRQLIEPIALFSYSATELTCEVGEIVHVLDQTHGWVWCKNSQQTFGWIPSKNLENI